MEKQKIPNGKYRTVEIKTVNESYFTPQVLNIRGEWRSIYSSVESLSESQEMIKCYEEQERNARLTQEIIHPYET